jgi:hypothetical protein
MAAAAARYSPKSVLGAQRASARMGEMLVIPPARQTTPWRAPNLQPDGSWMDLVSARRLRQAWVGFTRGI